MYHCKYREDDPSPKHHNSVSKIQYSPPHDKYGLLTTTCCGCVICDYEKHCPDCGNFVIGYDAKTDGERHKIRWKDSQEKKWIDKFMDKHFFNKKE
jgi:hypothetical protein